MTKRKNYRRVTRAEASKQLKQIENLLAKGDQPVREIMRKLKISRHACHHRLRILRNDGKVRYEWRDGSAFWGIGTMKPIDPKPRPEGTAPDIMLRWGGYRV